MHITAPETPSGSPPLEPHIESGLRWSATRQIVTGLAGTLGVLAYSRILNPADLGAFGLALLVYSGLLLLVEAPIRDAVVTLRGREAAYESAAFWLLLGFSLPAVAAVMALAGVMARFYQSPQAAGLTRVLAAAFLFQAISVVPAALLLKRFRFAIHEGLQTLIGLLLLAGWIGLSLAGFGPWSLAIPQLAISVVWAAATWIAAGFRPMLRPGRDAFRVVFRFSRSLFGSELMIYLKQNIDNAAVGLLGVQALGSYSFGEDQSTFAAVGVGAAIAQIALPAMAAVQDRLDELKRIYLDMLRLTATLTMPMQVGSIVLADLGFSVIFGPQWAGAVPVFRAYVAFRLVSTLLVISDAAISAIRRPDVRFAVDLAQMPFFIAGTWFGLRVWGGIVGVAWALTIVRTLAGLVYFAVTMRLTGITVRDVIRMLGPSALASALMGAAVYALRQVGVFQRLAAPIGPAQVADGIVLVSLVTVGALGYFALLAAIDRAGFISVAQEAWRILIPAGVRGRLQAILTRHRAPVEG